MGIRIQRPIVGLELCNNQLFAEATDQRWTQPEKEVAIEKAGRGFRRIRGVFGKKNALLLHGLEDQTDDFQAN